MYILYNEVYTEEEGTWYITSSHSYEPEYTNSLSGDIRINEVMTSNVSYGIGDQQIVADIIEIYNGTDHVVDLSDYALSDRLDDPERFSFGKNNTIAPEEYKLVLCTSEHIEDSRYICNSEFSLDSSGESLFLYHKSTNQIIGVVHIPELEAECS